MTLDRGLWPHLGLGLTALDAASRSRLAALIVCSAPSGLGARLVTDPEKLDAFVGQPGYYIGIGRAVWDRAAIRTLERITATIHWLGGGEPPGPELSTDLDLLSKEASL